MHSKLHALVIIITYIMLTYSTLRQLYVPFSVAGTSGLSLSPNAAGTSTKGHSRPEKAGGLRRLATNLWQSKKRFKPLDYIRAGFRHVNDLIEQDQEDGQHHRAEEPDIRRLVREVAARDKKKDQQPCGSRDMFASETIDLCRDDISTDSDDSFDHPSLIRVAKHYSSASSITSGDFTDYSDLDDIRNQLVDDYDVELDRVRNDAILGKEPQSAENDNRPPVTLGNIKDSVSKACTKVYNKMH